MGPLLNMIKGKKKKSKSKKRTPYGGMSKGRMQMLNNLADGKGVKRKVKRQKK